MQPSHPSIVLLEFNELCPSLMRRFMGEGKLPNFQRLYREAQVYETDAQEEAPYLEPWIQWVTVHSGMNYREHQIFHLADGHTLQQKCLWDILSEHGHRVWVCGSMNIRYEKPINGLVMPDPWSTEVPSSDPCLEPYFKFVQRNVLEYTNENIPLSSADYARFLAFMVTHGLSVGTVRAILEQLLSERQGHHRWKRAALLDKLQLDVFAHFYRKIKPSFSSFFINSTAHFQHLYWRNMEPDLFQRKPTEAEQAEYAQAILFGYQEMDSLLARFFDLAERDTTLIFCTALSQQPCLKYETDGGKLFYRPKDFARFVEFAGVEGYAEIVPVMSECFNIRFESAPAAAAARERLTRLRVGEAAAMFVEQRDQTLYSACSINSSVPQNAMLSMDGGGPSAPFFDHFYRVDGIKSGMHHPEGMLWIRQPDRMHRIHPQKIPLASVAPMILDMFSLTAPEGMRTKPPSGFAGLDVKAPALH
jgi:hypothetical protein